MITPSEFLVLLVQVIEPGLVKSTKASMSRLEKAV